MKTIRAYIADNSGNIMNALVVIMMAAVPLIGLGSATRDLARQSVYDHHYKQGLVVGGRYYDLTAERDVGTGPNGLLRKIAGNVDIFDAYAEGVEDAAEWYRGEARGMESMRHDHYMVQELEGNTAVVTAYRGGWCVKYRVARTPDMTPGHYTTGGLKPHWI